MEIQDYILVHGKIINIKNNVDDKYIWFDISKDEYYKDKDGYMKNKPSFFSARISKILSNKYILDTNIEVVVKGIPKGFIDKKGYRQNYIHVTELNVCNLNEDIFEKIIDYYKKIAEYQLKEYNMKHQYQFTQKYFVFGDINPIHPDVLRRHKNEYAKKVKIKEIRIHDFRHSCASLLVNNGANITVVAKHLGHTKIEETLNTYTHLFNSALNEVVDIIDKLE